MNSVQSKNQSSFVLMRLFIYIGEQNIKRTMPKIQTNIKFKPMQN